MRIVKEIEGEQRLHYLIRVAIAMLEENAEIIDCIQYDDAECDAYCLAEDLTNELLILSEEIK